MTEAKPQDRMDLRKDADQVTGPWNFRYPVFEGQHRSEGALGPIPKSLRPNHLLRGACFWGILIVVFASTITSTQAASDLPITLTCSAPSGCPDELAFRREIRGRIAPTARPTGPMQAQVMITPGPGNIWQLELRTHVGKHQGERIIRHETCAHLAEAAALIIALLIDPNASMVARPPPPLRPPLLSTPIVTLSILRWAVGADILAGFGVVPGTSEGARLRIGWSQRYWGMHLRSGGWRNGTATSRDLPGAGGTFSLYDFSGGPCMLSSTTHKFGVQVCAGPGLERMHGVSFGVSHPGSTTAWMLAFHLEGSIRLRVTSRLGFRGLIEGGLRSGRPAFTVRGLNHLHRPPLRSVKTGLGVDFIF